MTEEHRKMKGGLNRNDVPPPKDFRTKTTASGLGTQLKEGDNEILEQGRRKRGNRCGQSRTMENNGCVVVNFAGRKIRSQRGEKGGGGGVGKRRGGQNKKHKSYLKG